jgi:hypothetical protein
MSPDGDKRTEMPDPEVVPIARRRRFTVHKKLRIPVDKTGSLSSMGRE